MARIARDSKLETREARKRLSTQKEPYWRLIHQGAYIGYYKGDKSSSWVARYRHEGNKGGYQKKTLGKVDDFQDADGVNILNYRQAQLMAQEWFKTAGLIAEGHLPTGKYTVKDALDDYGWWYRAHRKSWERVEAQIKAHILPTFENIEVSKLTTRKLQDWHHKLAETPPRRRSALGNNNFGKIEGDEGKRKRKSTANRILTILKAALNKAYQDGKVPSDDVWRRVKPFKAVDSAIEKYLEIDEIHRLVNAAAPEFRPLVQAAVYTGCRYGELTALKVSDYNQDSKTLFVRESKSGKPRHVVLIEEAQAFFESSVLPGKNGNDLMFSREDGKAWGRSHQTRRLKEACKNARISPAISFHILRHTHASQLALNGVPLKIIAEQLGHADTRICEKHYAHLSPSYVADTIREKFPKLGIARETNIVKIRKKKA